MLKPIPERILQSTATVRVCTGVDRYQQQTFDTYTVRKVHIQSTHGVRKSTNSTSTESTVSARSTLFVDARISKPHLDWAALFRGANEIKGDVKVIIRGVEYTVVSVDELRDDEDRIHHYEIGLE